MPAEDFFRLARRAAFAEEAGGWVGSQYEKQILAGEGSVGTIGLYGCDQLVGAMSWGEHRLPRGGVSGRIDLVITEPGYRGLGIAKITMGTFVHDTEQRHGTGLEHLSVIAQHPAIGHIVRGWGFVATQCGSAPLHQIGLDGPKRAEVLGRIRNDTRERLSNLKMSCLQCKKHRWHQAWCRPQEAA